MPLRDHFQSHENTVPFDGVPDMWLMMMMTRIFDHTPPLYFPAPQVQRGARPDGDEPFIVESLEAAVGSSVPIPTLTFETDFFDQDQHEVRIYNGGDNSQLVATVMIVNPSNKDRLQNRRAFTVRCLALLQQGVCISIVDIVTAWRFNLYADLLDLIGRSDPAMGADPPATYAVTLRGDKRGRRPHVKTWSHALSVGQPLPTLPIGLADELWITLDLESSYERTCQFLGVTRLG